MRRSKGQAMPWPLDPQETRLLHRMLAEIDGQFEDIQRQPAGRLHVDLHDFERSFSPRHLRMRKSKGYAALVKKLLPYVEARLAALERREGRLMRRPRPGGVGTGTLGQVIP